MRRRTSSRKPRSGAMVDHGADSAVKAPDSLLPLRIEDVYFEAGGRRIIDGISLEIGAGARTVILGPNGAGKSGLMRICHGLLAPTSGRAAWRAAQRAYIHHPQA